VDGSEDGGEYPPSGPLGAEYGAAEPAGEPIRDASPSDPEVVALGE
jgi:hypothetical protein